MAERVRFVGTVSRCLWLSYSRGRPCAQVQDGPWFSDRFPVELDALRRLAVGNVTTVEFGSIEGEAALRLSWCPTLTCIYESESKGFREPVEVPDLLIALAATS